MTILKYKQEGDQPLAHIECKSLIEFVQFKNMKDMLVKEEGTAYCG
jgi:hypothetical protein